MADFQVAELVVAELAGSRIHCFASLGLAVTLLYLLAHAGKEWPPCQQRRNPRRCESFDLDCSRHPADPTCTSSTAQE
jgi:hypothetical protein